MQLLDSVKYLYLRELSEPRDNALRIVVAEAVVNPSGSVGIFSQPPELNKILAGASPIESTPDCRIFQLTWTHYVAYLVTEECVGSSGHYDDEIYSGNVFRVYTKSHFLEHLSRDTDGHTEPIVHFKLTCLNHLIDVATYARPEMRQIGPYASVAGALTRNH